MFKGLVRMTGCFFATQWTPGDWTFFTKASSSHYYLRVRIESSHAFREYPLCSVQDVPDEVLETTAYYRLRFVNEICAFIQLSYDQLLKLHNFVIAAMKDSNNSNAPLLKIEAVEHSNRSKLEGQLPNSEVNHKDNGLNNEFNSSLVDVISTMTQDTNEKENMPILIAETPPSHLKRSRCPSVSKSERRPYYITRRTSRRLANEEQSPYGFSNLGNTCYMNAILQALLHQKPFAQELWRAYEKSRLLLQPDSLLSHLSNLLRGSSGDPSVNKKDVLLSVKNKIASTARQFHGDSEHDAQEFILQLINQLNDEVRALNKSYPENQISNPVFRNFSFAICSYRKCTKCGHTTCSEEEFVDLPLDLHSKLQSFSLQKLVEAFFADGTVNRHCDKCNCDEAFAQSRITRLPRILVINVKRHYFNGLSSEIRKAENVISIPLFITLRDFCVSDAVDSADLTLSAKKAYPFHPTDDHKKGKQSRMILRNSKVLFRDEDSSNYTSEKAAVEDEFDMFALSPKDDIVEYRQEDEEPSSSSGSSSKRRRSEKSVLSESLIIGNDARFEEDLTEAIRLSIIESVVIFLSQQQRDQPKENCVELDGPSLNGLNNSLSPGEEELLRNEQEGFLPRSYKLCAVVNHIGLSCQTGHYITDVYDWKENEWFCFDDSKAKLTSLKEVQQQRKKTGYIFFYVDKKLLTDSVCDFVETT
ncbi:Ubiquitin carboxyl-terminal hydrolase 37 [Trichinella papuae]|uniref:Ubiquitin carboxyl-terminal hydrolase n=1 Tax=Trichinella papuae TaxID=268474 RepID=A0A0V1M419_9BILA|nr:Ubiquitin carboxyl-terminal hydrolase 37 [Trichinella papuae]KRZ66463.1 Ubiquitin carboxyl-terminal hydrolase 37 [Trichinella papuae]KRZ66464.1 Ubiquitin carboxyl-terminal hydrolase 37 [Trichinella papuae]